MNIELFLPNLQLVVTTYQRCLLATQSFSNSNGKWIRRERAVSNCLISITGLGHDSYFKYPNCCSPLLQIFVISKKNDGTKRTRTISPIATYI